MGILDKEKIRAITKANGIEFNEEEFEEYDAEAERQFRKTVKVAQRMRRGIFG